MLAGFLPRFNRRFTVAAADPTPAWRPAPGRAAAERICCLKYRRVVANDHTVRAGATVLQLPPRADRRSYAGARVELQLRLDGRLVVWDGARELLSLPAPAHPIQLRTMSAARSDLGRRPPGAGYRPSANHPWRRGPITRRSPAVTRGYALSRARRVLRSRVHGGGPHSAHKNPLFILAVHSPGLAGLFLVWRHFGLKGPGSLLRRLTMWRISLSWWMR